MKIFSVAMSIYILGLMFVPCADVHAEIISDNINIHLLSEHNNNIDLCTPFCICDCCQKISQPVINNYFTCFFTLIETTVPFIQTSEYSVPITLWRPPKI